MPEETKDGRFALAHPVDGGFQFWEINDMQKMFAVVSVSNTLPFAEEIAREAFAKIKKWHEDGR